MRLEAVVASRLPRVSDGEFAPRLTVHRSTAVSNVEPAKSDLARAGRRFTAIVGNGATFKAPVTAVPAAAAAATWFLFNGESAGGKTYFIDRVDAFLASGTMGVGGSLICSVSRTPATIPTAYAATTTGSLSGSGSTKAILANAVTTIATGQSWFIIGGDANHGVAAATIGSLFSGKLDGGVAIPPQYGLAVEVLSATGTTALYGVSLTWDELVVELE